MTARLDDTISVAPQISADDVMALKQAGFTSIVNNRPDGEADGQPAGDQIRAAAEAAGLRYVAIPVGHDGFNADQVAAMRAALAEADGPTLAYCRSGTRSTYLWALARASAGDAPDALIGKAAAAGYDIAALRPTLETLRP